MKSKSICFCIRGRNRKSKENDAEDSEKPSHAKPPHKGNNEGFASTTPGGDGVSGNIDGGSTIASNDAGAAAAVATAAHVSVVSANEGEDGTGRGHGHGHGHVGESGG